MLDLRGPVILRPFELADACQVEPWLTGRGLSLPAGRASRDWPERLIADPRITAGIAEQNGRAVGFVRLDCGPDMIADVTLVVAPNRRRRGHGRAMFEAVLRQARGRSIRGFVAHVDLHSVEALEFFRSLGFDHEGMVGDRLRMVRLVHAGPGQAPLDIEC